MYAIIEVGSSQYKVSQGDKIETNRLNSEKGKDITLEKILFFSNGSDVRIGRPYLQGVKVEAKVIGHPRGDKVFAFKFRRRKGYHKKRGHRQELTELNITKIEG